MASPPTVQPPNTLPYILPETITRTTPLLPVSAALIGIQQRLEANRNATGAAPATTPTIANGLIKYPAPTAADGGGLFDFESLDAIVVFPEFDLGASTTLTIKIVNMGTNNTVIAGEETMVYTGSVRYYAPTEPFRLTSRQALQVTTSGGSAAMVLRVKAQLQINYQG